MTFIISEFIQYFFQIILSKFNLFVHPQLRFPSDHSKIQVGKKKQDSKLTKMPSFGIVRRDEVELLMGNLGIFYNQKGENFADSLSSNDMFNMFEDEQPRFDEIKEAFDVFDENKDGFIDASELQRVLYALGLKDRAETDDCKKMIKVFDENDDGNIDFDEFLKFVEGTFC